MHIKGIGIIDDITINFTDGLNILTGETGAGKSLIIDALNIITGSRISKELIKKGNDMALIEGCFFEKDNALILAREVYQNGRSICKIDGKMVTLSQLKEVGEGLIDIHGQHDNQSLLNEHTHIDLLDGFAENELKDLKCKYIEKLRVYKNIKVELQKNYGDPAERARRIDIIKYQIDEIKNASLKEGEEEKLEDRRKFLMNAEKISKGLNNTYKILEGNVLDNLNGAMREIGSISNIDEEYSNIQSQIETVFYTLEELSSDVNKLINKTDFDEGEQNEIEERLDIIFSLKRKYGDSISKIIEYKNKLEEELEYLENSEEITLKLKNDLDKNSKELMEISEKIRSVREKVSVIIEKEINKVLQSLEMKKAFVKFNFEPLTEFLENGMDDVRLYISTNVGEEPKPLEKIASGGELSRVMLAIKAVLGKYDNISTMVFDEIDTGISGQAGKAVAEKLKLLGKTHQIICVTHLPSIAASGDSNYYIKKVVKNNKTSVMVKKLQGEEIVEEIARILAGNDITKAVLEHARELKK